MIHTNHILVHTEIVIPVRFRSADQPKIMNELETFIKFTLDKGGVWFRLEKSDSYSLYKSQDKYLYKHNYYFTPAVYQIFDAEGKRVFASTNYRQAYEHYEYLIGCS